MSINVDALRAQFPVGTDVPDLLRRLIDWRNNWSERNPNSDLRDFLGFDLCDRDVWLKQWFGEEVSGTASQFAVFSTDPTGSMFA